MYLMNITQVHPINMGSYVSLMCCWKVPQGLIYKAKLSFLYTSLASHLGLGEYLLSVFR